MYRQYIDLHIYLRIYDNLRDRQFDLRNRFLVFVVCNCIWPTSTSNKVGRKQWTVDDLYCQPIDAKKQWLIEQLFVINRFHADGWLMIIVIISLPNNVCGNRHMWQAGDKIMVNVTDRKAVWSERATSSSVERGHSSIEALASANLTVTGLWLWTVYRDTFRKLKQQ